MFNGTSTWLISPSLPQWYIRPMQSDQVAIYRLVCLWVFEIFIEIAPTNALFSSKNQYLLLFKFPYLHLFSTSWISTLIPSYFCWLKFALLFLISSDGHLDNFQVWSQGPRIHYNVFILAKNFLWTLSSSPSFCISLFSWLS